MDGHLQRNNFWSQLNLDGCHAWQTGLRKKGYTLVCFTDRVRALCGSSLELFITHTLRMTCHMNSCIIFKIWSKQTTTVIFQ